MQEESEWVDESEAFSGDVVDQAEAVAPPEPGIVQRTFLVLHLFSGKRREFGVEWWLLTLGEREGVVLEVLSIDMDIHPAIDLTRQELLERLEDLIKRGRVHGVIGGPPCST